MRRFTRRFFLSAAALATAFTSRAGFANDPASLPEAAKSGGMPLLEALSLRRSTRLYADKPVEEEKLSTVDVAVVSLRHQQARQRRSA